MKDQEKMSKDIKSVEERDGKSEQDFSSAMQAVKRYAELCRRKRELASEKREVQKQIDRLMPSIRDMLLQSGVDNMKVNVPERGDMTIYIHRQVWASPAHGVSNAEAVKVLQEYGYEDMTMPSHQSVSTLFRGEPEEVEGLHPKIKETFEATEKTSVRVRKA